MFSKALAALAFAAPLVSAQTFTSCNPLEKGTSHNTFKPPQTNIHQFALLILPLERRPSTVTLQRVLVQLLKRTPVHQSHTTVTVLSLLSLDPTKLLLLPRGSISSLAVSTLRCKLHLVLVLLPVLCCNPTVSMRYVTHSTILEYN
jgi:hypothetical protein